MSSRFAITEIQASDVPVLIEIAARSDLSAWSAVDYELEAARDDSIMLGSRPETGGELAGFIVGRTIPGFEVGLDAEIYNIGVCPEYRRLGLGQMLMEQFLKVCTNLNVKTVWLDVRAENEYAIAFYRSFGFSEAYRRPGFYSSPLEDAIVMELARPLLRV